jgi:hypothetical protein
MMYFAHREYHSLLDAQPPPILPLYLSISRVDVTPAAILVYWTQYLPRYRSAFFLQHWHCNVRIVAYSIVRQHVTYALRSSV